MSKMDHSPNVWAKLLTTLIQRERESTNSESNNSELPLLQAASMGNVKAVSDLLDARSDLLLSDDKGNTALHLAARNGHSNVVAHICKRQNRSMPNSQMLQLLSAKNKNLEVPLHCAASKGNAEIVKRLLECGSDINAKDKKGFTPLHHAAESGQFEVISELLDARSDLLLTDDDGNNVLHVAATKGQFRVITYILEYQTQKISLPKSHLWQLLSGKNNNKETPLHLAVFIGNIEVVKRLLQGGSNISAKNILISFVNSTDQEGNSPLHYASAVGLISIIELLLDAGADPNAKSKSGQTPLWLATPLATAQQIISDIGRDISNSMLYSNKHLLNIIELFLKKGYDVNSEGLNGKTLLHFAATRGFSKVVEHLVTHGARLDVCDATGNTPVFLAARMGHTNIVEILLRAGASPEDPKNGESILHATAIHNRFHTCQSILTHFSKKICLESKWKGHTADIYASNFGNGQLAWWLRKRFENALKTAKKSENNPNKDSTNVSPWRLSRELYEEKGSYSIDQAGIVSPKLFDMIENGEADMHYMDEAGDTILHVAIANQNDANEKQLVKLGALRIARNYTNQIARDIKPEPLPLDSRMVSHLYAVLLNIISQTDRLEIPDVNIPTNSVENAKVYDANVGHLETSYLDGLEMLLGMEKYSFLKIIVNYLSEISQMNEDPVNSIPSVLSKHLGNMFNLNCNEVDECRSVISKFISGDIVIIEAILNSTDFQIFMACKFNIDISKFKILGLIRLFRKLDVSKGYLTTIFERIFFNTVSDNISYLDKMIQELKLETVRIVSKILELGIPLDPIGSHERNLLPLAITTNNRTLLPLLLAAGAPLTTTVSGMGMVQLAWLTPDITTWVCMVVTRAVLHRLQAERNTIEEYGNSNAPAREQCEVLSKCISKLVEDLNGEKPFEARFCCPDKVSLADLFVVACKAGVTMAAWYIWHSGGSLYEESSGLAALKAAVSEKQIYTASRLVLDMKTNPFILENGGNTPRDEFPSGQLLELMLGQDYRRLDRLQEKAKDKCDKIELQQIILLLMILYIQHDKKLNKEYWRAYFAFVLTGYSKMPETTNNWMFTLKKLLEEEGVNGNKMVEIPNIKRDIQEKHEEIGLTSTKKLFHLDDTKDNFCSLFKALEQNFSCSDLTAKEVSETDMLLQKAFRICCEDHMPLFLHLLVTIANMNVDMIISNVCHTTPLHHAARYDNLSAIAYLLARDASSATEDRSGILPVEYAFMYGHTSSGKYLLNHMKKSPQNTDIEQRASKFKNGHRKYLENYGLRSKSNNRSRYIPIKHYDQLLSDRLECLRKQWEEKGIRAFIAKFLVDYEKGEDHEVKVAVDEFLKSLVAIMAKDPKNKIFYGTLEFVGSSEDNVRLFCPDEYDCNLCLKNVSAHSGGGLECKLLEFKDDRVHLYGHEKYLEISYDKHLEDVFEGSKFLDTFYESAVAAVKRMDLKDKKLKIFLPGIKRTQVGVAFSLLWQGEIYPILFVDVDLVPAVRVPRPSNLNIPKCSITESDLSEVYINSIGNGEWRFSFGKLETMLMQKLLPDQREVYLACKMILYAFKTENWVPHKLKQDFMYWDSQLFSMSSKGGFALKNSFFRELEEITNPQDWERTHFLKRMCSVFKRMCKDPTNARKKEDTKLPPDLEMLKESGDPLQIGMSESIGDHPRLRLFEGSGNSSSLGMAEGNSHSSSQETSEGSGNSSLGMAEGSGHSSLGMAEGSGNSVSLRMSEGHGNSSSLGVSEESDDVARLYADRIRAYFGGDAEKPSIYLIAPDILKFLESLDSSIIDK